MVEQGLIKADTVKESISLELDMINILCVNLHFLVLVSLRGFSIRLVQILSMSSNRK